MSADDLQVVLADMLDHVLNLVADVAIQDEEGEVYHVQEGIEIPATKDHHAIIPNAQDMMIVIDVLTHEMNVTEKGIGIVSENVNGIENVIVTETGIVCAIEIGIVKVIDKGIGVVVVAVPLIVIAPIEVAMDENVQIGIDTVIEITVLPAKVLNKLQVLLPLQRLRVQQVVVVLLFQLLQS